MADGGHFETSYLYNRSTDFDKNWHGEANCPPDPTEN